MSILTNEEIQDIRMSDLCPTCSCQALEFYKSNNKLKAVDFKCDRCGTIIRYAKRSE